MNWISSHRRSAALVAITLFLPLFFYLKTVFGLANLGFAAAGERTRIEPRVARLQGLLDNADRLARQSAAAQSALADVVYAADQDASALAAALQADVRQVFSEAGLKVSNSQVMPSKEGEYFDRVSVKLTVTGSLPALDAALIGVAAYRPMLLVESIDAFPARAARRGAPSAQQLTAVVQLMVLKDSV